MRLRAVLALALAAALSLAACGGGGGGTSAPPAGNLATVVPADVPLFVEGAVRPQGGLEAALRSSLGKLLGTPDPGAKIVAAFDRTNRDNHVTYERDLGPWLGERAGVFVQSLHANPVGMAQTSDPKTAVESLRRAAIADGHRPHPSPYRGVTLEEAGGDSFATVGNLVLTGPTSGVKAGVDASKASSLADSAAYQSSLAGVPSDDVFTAWADPKRILGALVSEGQLSSLEATQARSQLGRLASQPVVVWGDASPSYLAIEASGASSAAGASTPSSLLGSLPSDSWLAFAVHETAAQVKRIFGESSAAASLGARSATFLRALSRLGLDPATLSKWVGDVSGFLRGQSILGLGGALVIQTRDAGASALTLRRIETALRRDPNLVIQSARIGGGQAGFTLTPRGAPIQVVFTQNNGEVVIGLGLDSVHAALSPSQGLSGSSAFKAATAALGSGISPQLYLDFQPLASLFEIPGVITDPQFQQVKPYLARLDYLVAGTGQSGGRSLARIALGVRGGRGSSSGNVAARALPKYAALQP